MGDGEDSGCRFRVGTWRREIQGPGCQSEFIYKNWESLSELLGGHSVQIRVCVFLPELWLPGEEHLVLVSCPIGGL